MRDLSLHLLDIIQNSIAAKAKTVSVILSADCQKDRLLLKVSDDGAGMDRAFLEKAADPFVTTRKTRRVGMGLPMLKNSSAMAGGRLEVDSERGVGTTVSADFKISHIDRLPLGDIGETVSSLVLGNPDIKLQLLLERGSEKFNFDSFEIKNKLGDVPITDFNVINWICGHVNEAVKAIFGGVLNEVDS